MDAVRGCVAVERGTAASTASSRPTSSTAPGWTSWSYSRGGVLGERPVTLDGIGQTIEVTAPGMAGGTPVTAIAIPYFQWDNRDGRAMRVWMPASRGDDPLGPPHHGGLPAPYPWPPGLGPDAVEVLERELVQVLVGQAPLGQRVHVGARLADVAPGLTGVERRRAELVHA